MLGVCRVASGEVDDYVANGDSECDATWTNYSVTGGYASHDHRTGLLWSRGSAAGDFVSEKDGVADGRINWYEATGTTTVGGSANCTAVDHTDCNTDGESYCGKLNAIAYGGYTTWRAPGQKEFMQAYIDGGSHLATVIDVTQIYWADTSESDSTALWGAFFEFGWAHNADFRKNTNTLRGICVTAFKPAEILAVASCKSAANDVDDFVANGNNECDSSWTNVAVAGGNISTDERTGLMWSRTSAAGDFVSEKDGVADGRINWYEATGTTTVGGSANCTVADQSDCNTDGESYCGTLNTLAYGGYSDWRMPGKKELMQAYIDAGSHLAAVFNLGAFYWANTTESDNAAWAGYQRFGYGNGSVSAKNTNTYRAICVRSTR